MWISENEGAKFWFSVLTELQHRGIKDIVIIAFVDALKGFFDTINSLFPNTQIQLCIIHMLRNSLKHISWKEYNVVRMDLKCIYQSTTEEAFLALEELAKKWDEKYLQISPPWRANWDNLNTIFNYPIDIRKAIYRTNPIDFLNSLI